MPAFQTSTGWTPYIHPIEPELNAPVPRAARLAPRAVREQWFLWTMLVATVALLGFLGQRDYTTWNALLARGVVTQAVPVDKYLTYYGKVSKSTPYILYRFQTDAASHTFSRPSYGNWATQEKPPVSVTYLPGAQGRIWQEGIVSEARRNSNAAGWVVTALITTCLWGAGIYVTSVANKKQLSLLRGGVATSGTVRATQVSRRGDRKRYVVYYVYWTGSDKYKGEIFLPPADYEQIAQKNAHFTVLYDPAHPAEHAPYFQITQARLAASAA